MTTRYAIIGDVATTIHGAGFIPAGAAAIAIALAGLGGQVTVRSAVGEDDPGRSVLDALERSGVATSLIDRHPDQSTTTLDASGQVLSHGVGLHKGARMNIYELFSHDVLILDAVDQPLRRFLTDLPAHTAPAVRLLGTLRRLDVRTPTPDELDIAMRFDTIVGTAAQLAVLAGEPDAWAALDAIHARMPGAHLRAAVAVLSNAILVVDRAGRAEVTAQRAGPPTVAASVAALMAAHVPITRLGDPAAR